MHSVFARSSGVRRPDDFVRRLRTGWRRRDSPAAQRSYRLKPTGADAVLHLRELLDVRGEKIAGSVLTFNVNDLVNQLTSVDYDELAKRVDAICDLRNELAHAAGERRREETKQLGAKLDAARRAVRPHVNR